MNGILHPSTGAPLAAGTVNFYAAGTTTAKNAWTAKDKTGAITSATLAADGTYQAYGDGEYKLVIKDSSGATRYTWDNVRCQYPNFAIISKAAAYTATPDDDFILVDTSGGNVTISLQPSANFSKPLTIKNIGENSVIIDPDGSETIDGSATLTISTEGQSIELAPDGSNWYKTEDMSAAITALATLTPAANKPPYFTGTTADALADLTAWARTLLDDADLTTAKITLGIDVLEMNMLLNAFRIAINGSLVKFNMVDGIVDEFEDESGVDTGTSTNESYDAGTDSYSPLIAVTAWSDTLDANDSGYSGYTVRQVLAAADISTSGSKIRVTLEASGAGNFSADNVSIVERDADANGTTTPTEILFSGGSGVAITAGQTKV